MTEVEKYFDYWKIDYINFALFGLFTVVIILTY